MKKLITIIIILIAVSCNAQDTVKTFTKIYNYGKDVKDTTMLINLKKNVTEQYQKDLQALNELNTKILKEQGYLELLEYLINEERKK